MIPAPYFCDIHRQIFSRKQYWGVFRNTSVGQVWPAGNVDVESTKIRKTNRRRHSNGEATSTFDIPRIDIKPFNVFRRQKAFLNLALPSDKWQLFDLTLSAVFFYISISCCICICMFLKC